MSRTRSVKGRSGQTAVMERTGRRQFTEDLEFKPIQQMTAAEIDYEIGILMREKLRQEEEETMLVLMMALNE